VVVRLNKPIFFVEEGKVQITLEGKEVFQHEESPGFGGSGQRSGPVQKTNHIEKFYRDSVCLYDSNNETDVFELKARHHQKARQQNSAGQPDGVLHVHEIDRSVFLDEGVFEFPFSIDLEAQGKKPPTFCLMD
jgi:hypothetical protein